MVLSKALVLAKLSQWSAAGLLGVASIWWVVEHVGGPTGTVIYHAGESPINVAVGDRTFHVADPHSGPLIFDLPAGRHELRLSRGDRVLHREVFTLGGGEQLTRGARVPRWPRPSRPSPHRGVLHRPGRLSPLSTLCTA